MHIGLSCFMRENAFSPSGDLALLHFMPENAFEPSNKKIFHSLP